MPTATLTIKFIDALKPTPTQRTEYWDTVVRGLALRVSERGVKSWSLMYRVNGVQRRMTLGDYPALTLAAARQVARQHLGTVARGIDPVVVKRDAARQAATERRGETVAALAKAYVAHVSNPAGQEYKRSWREDARILAVNIVPAWGPLKVKALTRQDVKALVEGIAANGAPVLANRALALVSRVLRYALDREWITATPAIRITRPAREQPRSRALTSAEIWRIWHALAEESAHVRAYVQLRLLTGQRSSETLAMRWSDLDLGAGRWLIPAHVTKNGKPHAVPLAARAVEILAALPQVDDLEWVFPGRVGRRHRQDSARAFRRIVARAHVTDARSHDLRRAVATGMGAAGIATSVISRILNHTVADGAKVTHTYNVHNYWPEKQHAIRVWANVLERIVTEQPDAQKIVPFARA
jgi:integrase